MDAVKIDERVLQIAKTCHEVNRAWCLQNGDESQPKWEDAPVWQRESAIKGVEYHLTNPKSTPADSHNSWMKEKTDNGWVWGEEKDEKAKTHPCIVSYDNLSEVDRFKDTLFLTVVRSFE
jgi:hypothetical protein